jgi:uncharacterized protein with HEPN domain
MSSNDQPNVLAMLDAISRISDYMGEIRSAEEYYRTSVVFDATLMNFVVMGEMVDRLSSELKERHPEVDWQKIKDFRNLVAHDYLGIDAEEVWGRSFRRICLRFRDS